MRMVGPDIVLFVVGALLFSGATYGLVQYSGGAEDSNLGLYLVTWQQGESTADVGRYAEGQAAQMFMANVTGTNLVKLIFTFQCADPSAAKGANPFRYSVTFGDLPEGLAKPDDVSTQACDSSVEREVVINTTAPAEQQIQSADGETAKADAAKLGNATGSGEYHLTVNGARTQAVPGPIGGTAGGASVTVTVRVVSYQSNVAAINAAPK